MTTAGDATLSTYSNEEYGYSLAYPADWSVEPDSDGGATFAAPQSAAGAAVFVEKHEHTPATAAAAFLDELAADEHVHALELLAQRETVLQSGQPGHVVECTYAGDSSVRWWLAYLFAREADTGYTVGVDWNDDAVTATASAILESFALGAS